MFLITKKFGLVKVFFLLHLLVKNISSPLVKKHQCMSRKLVNIHQKRTNALLSKGSTSVLIPRMKISIACIPMISIGAFIPTMSIDVLILTMNGNALIPTMSIGAPSLKRSIDNKKKYVEVPIVRENRCAHTKYEHWCTK